jgi:hypothetical protein
MAREDRLVIPTLTGYTDVFRPAVSKKNSKAFLFNPQDDRYQVKGSMLQLDGQDLTEDEVIRLARDVSTNRPIEENVLIYGLFSYLILRKGLSHSSSFDIGITDISRFFGVTMGGKGFQLLEKLQSLQMVFGVIVEPFEVFHLLTVKHEGKKLRVTTDFMHRALKAMMAISDDGNSGKPFFYTDLVHANLVTVRNKVAAIVAVELVRLIVTAGRNQPHISFFRLEQYVPQIRAIHESDTRNSTKNRDLKRIFKIVYSLLEGKTELKSMFVEFSVDKVIPTVNKFYEVINVNHGGYHKI